MLQEKECCGWGSLMAVTYKAIARRFKDGMSMGDIALTCGLFRKREAAEAIRYVEHAIRTVLKRQKGRK